MCTAEDEPLILQQFLRFSVTRPLTQQLILQELCEKNADTKAKLQEHMMKLMSNNNTNKAALELQAEVTKGSSLSGHGSPTSSHQPPASLFQAGDRCGGHVGHDAWLQQPSSSNLRLPAHPPGLDGLGALFVRRRRLHLGA